MDKKITRVLSTGKVVHQGTGNDGVMIVDAWSGQDILHIDDIGDEGVINLLVIPKGNARINPSDHNPGDYEVFADRTEPVTTIAVWSGGFARAFRALRRR